MKIVTIIGARPQFIKAAVVSRAFAASKETSYQGGSCSSGTTFIQYGYAGRDKPYLDRPYQ